MNNGTKKIRPWFLGFLCYLTLFGSSYMLLSSFTALVNLDQAVLIMSSSMEKVQVLFESALQNEAGEAEQVNRILGDIQSGNTRTNMRDHHIFMVISNLLTLFGAMFMLRLRRNGFRLYVLGTIIGIIAPVLVFGLGNFLGFAYALSGSIFGGLFILLYALKIKHMD